MRETFTVQELAEYLKIHPKTLQRKARNGEIPAIKIGRQFRFDKEQIDRWVSRNTVIKSFNILVIDDDPTILRLLTRSLNVSGHQVNTFTNGFEALEFFNTSHVDLVFLDLMMPGINGAEILGRIRQIDRQIPVAVITGYPDSDLMSKAMEHGPFIILKKPFTSDDILNTIRSLVEGVATIKTVRLKSALK